MRWGRSVYANIQKFIQFQLTVNVAALVINVVAAISAGEVPLTAVQVRNNRFFLSSHLHKSIHLKTNISMLVKSLISYLCSFSGSIL